MSNSKAMMAAHDLATATIALLAGVHPDVAAAREALRHAAKACSEAAFMKGLEEYEPAAMDAARSAMLDAVILLQCLPCHVETGGALLALVDERASDQPAPYTITIEDRETIVLDHETAQIMINTESKEVYVQAVSNGSYYRQPIISGPVVTNMTSASLREVITPEWAARVVEAHDSNDLDGFDDAVDAVDAMFKVFNLATYYLTEEQFCEELDTSDVAEIAALLAKSPTIEEIIRELHHDDRVLIMDDADCLREWVADTLETWAHDLDDAMMMIREDLAFYVDPSDEDVEILNDPRALLCDRSKTEVKKMRKRVEKALRA